MMRFTINVKRVSTISLYSWNYLKIFPLGKRCVRPCSFFCSMNKKKLIYEYKKKKKLLRGVLWNKRTQEKKYQSQYKLNKEDPIFRSRTTKKQQQQDTSVKRTRTSKLRKGKQQWQQHRQPRKPPATLQAQQQRRPAA